MAEPVYPKVCEKELEEERKDAAFYGNPYWYEVSELAALGLLARSLLSQPGVEPSELVAKLAALVAVHEARSHEKTVR